MMNEEKTRWPLPATFPALLSDQVHLWRASLVGTHAQLDLYRELLSVDESERARRFAFDRDRRRYIMARGTLRTLLGRYLNMHPRAIAFDYGAHGKPFLSRATCAADLDFNVSHAHELAVYGFTRQRRIGIDIEYQRPLPEMAQLASTVFSERELAAFEAVAAPLRLAAFYAGWTRKEAFIKAIGDGLSYPLSRFDVSLAPNEPAQLLEIRGDGRGHRRWTMDSFVPEEGYEGAFVVEAEEALNCQHFAFDPLRWPAED